MPMRFVKPAFMRSLRFRLTVTTALFAAFLLTALGFFFQGVLSSVLEYQMRDILNEEWGAVKGYLVIHKREPTWQYDRTDQEEQFIVDRLRRVFLLADAKGQVIDYSPLYEDLGLNTPQEIQAAIASKEPFWQERVSSEGEPYLIRGGIFIDDNDQTYFVCIGRSLAHNRRTLREFMRNYYLLLPLLILSGSLLAWFVAGRALRPVHELAQAAERISGANLSLRIPPRNSGDELDHLITTFNRMMARLESSFEMTRQFSTDVSHELGTPLTAIRGQLEVALFTAQTKEQYREAMINALEDVERLSQTVRAMLLLSQAESGQLELQKAPLDLAALAEDVVAQYQIPAEEAQVSLSFNATGQCRMEGDRVQIERLISNLLSNAVKYTPAGGSIQVSVWTEGAHVVLQVQDSGPGIPPDHLSHIFDRFYRVPGSSKDKHGLGLGLSFVAWIVKAHGGRIEVDSKPGAGARFTVRLPIQSHSLAAAASIPPAAASTVSGA